MSRVVHVTSVHPCYDARIRHRECASLAAAGYDVTLVCPTNTMVPASDDVRVVGVDSPQARGARMSVGAWRCMSAALESKPDIIHIHDPELLVPALRARLRRIQVIYDVHEDVPRQVRAKRWIPSWARPGVSTVSRVAENALARAMSGFVVAHPTLVERFSAMGPTALVQNFPHAADKPERKSDKPPSSPLEIVYVGAISEIRGIRGLIAGLNLARERCDVELVLAGRFWPPSLEQDLRRAGDWSGVRFVGWQARADVDRLLGDADVGAVLFRPEPHHLQSCPTKLFEYMMAGLPVIASDFPLWREVLEPAGCAVLVDPDSPEEIAEAIARLASDGTLRARMGDRARAAALASYNWQAQFLQLQALYSRLLTPEAP